MKKIFLIVYGLIVFAVTVWFMIYGEHPRDPRFYFTLLALLLIGKVIAHFMERRE